MVDVNQWPDLVQETGDALATFEAIFGVDVPQLLEIDNKLTAASMVSEGGVLGAFDDIPGQTPEAQDQPRANGSGSNLQTADTARRLGSIRSSTDSNALRAALRGFQTRLSTLEKACRPLGR